MTANPRHRQTMTPAAVRASREAGDGAAAPSSPALSPEQGLALFAAFPPRNETWTDEVEVTGRATVLPAVADSQAVVAALADAKATAEAHLVRDREDAALRLGGQDAQGVATGYFTESFIATIRKKRKKASTVDASDIAESAKSLQTVAGAAGQAAVAIAIDKWLVSRGEPLPKTLTGRTGTVVKTAVLDGADPIWAIRCACGIHEMAKVYDDAYTAAHGERPTMSMLGKAVFAALDLSINGRSWRLVAGALQMAASEKTGYIERYYDTLHAREGGRTYVAAGSRPTYSVTDTVAAAIELVRAKSQKEAA